MTERRSPFPRVVWLLPVVLAGLAPAAAPAQTGPGKKAVPELHAPAPVTPVPVLTLADLLRLGLEQNPDLRQVNFDVEAARGRAVQAGLYPNPTVNVMLDELGDPNGPAGMNKLPLITQEIVTGHKLELSTAAAARGVDQAALAVVRQRFTLFTAIRQGYFEVLTVRRRVEVLAELVKIAQQSVEQTRVLVESKLAARLDLLQLQVELNRLRAELAATRREQAAAWQRLTAVTGVPGLAEVALAGSLEGPVPKYDFEASRARLLAVHPEVRSAEVGVARAQLMLKRAQVEPIPNVTVGAGYVRDNQNPSNEWTFQVSLPVPVFNRNQGNVQAAQGELGRAVQEVARVQNDLTGRLATAFGRYAAARERAEGYRTAILPDAREANAIALESFKGGQFEYLRVLQAQRTVQEANLEYVRALGELWQAASEVAGLLLEECWPAVDDGQANPRSGPEASGPQP